MALADVFCGHVKLTGSRSTAACTLATAGVAIGDKIEVLCIVDNATGQTVTGVTDDAGNTYHSGGVSSSVKGSLELWYSDCDHTCTTSTVVTVTWAAANAADHKVTVCKITGSPASGAPPQTNNNGSASFVSTWSSGAVTTTDPAAIVRGCAIANSSSATSNTPNANYPETYDEGIGRTGVVVARVTSATGSYTPIGTWVGATTTYDAISWTWNTGGGGGGSSFPIGSLTQLGSGL